MIFSMQGVPSIAFSSELIEGLLEEVIHTPNDRVEGVSVTLIAQATTFLTDLVQLGW